jgi:hypothetical protein
MVDVCDDGEIADIFERRGHSRLIAEGVAARKMVSAR